MSLNIAKVNDLESMSKKVRTRELQVIIDDMKYYDLEAAYQRDECWTPTKEKNLIRSILKGIPIGSVHLVKKNNAHIWNVLDGKQRLTAVKHFIENKFSVTWNEKEYYWNDLQKEINQSILYNFMKFELSIVEWGVMTILDQRNLFQIINESENLNTAEKIYCPNFFGRSLMKFIYEKCFKKISKNVRGEIESDKRFSGIMWVHRMCCLTFGPNLDDVFGIRKTDKTCLTNSARILDNILCEYFEKNEGQDIENFSEELITQETIEKLGYEKNIKLIGKVADAVFQIVNFENNSITKKENSIDIMDFIVFLCAKIQQGILSTSQIKDDLKIFVEFYKKYVEEKANKLMARHTTDIDSVTKRYAIFEEMFNLLEIDKGKKNQLPTESEKAFALLNAPSLCPITNQALSDTNICIDHVNPKSKSSKTKFAVISEAGNRIKSNLTLENLNSLVSYVKNQQ